MENGKETSSSNQGPTNSALLPRSRSTISRMEGILLLRGSIYQHSTHGEGSLRGSAGVQERGFSLHHGQLA